MPATEEAVLEPEAEQAEQAEQKAEAQPGKPESSQPTAEQVEAEEKALFDKLTAEEGSGEAESKPDVEAKEAKEAKESKESEDSEPETEAKDQEAEEKTVDEPPEGFDDALAALVRDGMSEDAIQALYKTDAERFIEYGAKRLKAQKDQDQFGPEYREWLKTHPNGKDAEAPEEKAETAQPAASESDVDKTIAEVFKGLKDDELHSEMAEPLEKIVKALREHTQSDLKVLKDEISQRDSAIAELSNRNDELRKNVVDDRLERARSHHLEKYPALKDDEVQERVLQMYDDLVEKHPERFKTVEAAYERALRAELGGLEENDESKIATRVKEALFTRTTKQRAGRPKVPTSAPTPPPETDDDKEWKTFVKLTRQYDGEHAI